MVINAGQSTKPLKLLVLIGVRVFLYECQKLKIEALKCQDVETVIDLISLISYL